MTGAEPMGLVCLWAFVREDGMQYNMNEFISTFENGNIK